MRSFALLALAGAVAAQYRGFNYGATNNDGSVRAQQDFEDEFNRAKNLAGTSAFASARLYTMIQAGTLNTATSAIPAAIDTQTTLLLGLWASQDQAGFDNELAALSNAISQYGTAFTQLIAGISVGSEDLYRVSPTGIENNSGIGATPDQLVTYINQVRGRISGTAASGAAVGHVDTWTAWVNGSNAAVINAVDWLGTDAYPYFQTTQANSIGNSPALFDDAFDATVAVAGGKQVWITETGYPYEGPTANQGVPSIANAQTYWKAVACKYLGNVNTWWYTLYDPQPTGGLSFGIVGPNLDSAPLFDLSCNNENTQTSTSSSAPLTTTAASPTKPTTAAVSTTQSLVTSPNVETSPVSRTTVPSTEITATISSNTGAMTSTEHSTTLITVTSCKDGCKTTSSVQPAKPSTSTPVSTGKACPTDLSGQYEYPHLIVPVDSAKPDTAYGTSYNGSITPSISSIFNFDIPSSYAGKTCSLVFLFPKKSQLETSSFSFNGMGGISVKQLSAPATEQTTYSNVPAPAAAGISGTISNVQPGNSYLVASQACGAGQRIAFEFSSQGGLDLDYFQDYSPSPIGAYITVC